MLLPKCSKPWKRRRRASLVDYRTPTGRIGCVSTALSATWYELYRASFSACPVCGCDSMQPDAIPRDAVLDQFVVDALEQARNSKAALLETAAEWEPHQRARSVDTATGLQNFRVR